jgi:AcrR family transcriptional regulator
MDKKVKLLAAATKIFAKDGYKDASVDDIVKSAAVAKGTFYYYFKSKDDLFLALISTGTDKLSEEMVIESNKYSDPIEKVRAIILSQYKFFDNNRDLCRVLLSEIWRFESKWKQKYEIKRNLYIKAMEQAIILGQDTSVFDKEIETKTASIAIFGLVATSALDCTVSNNKLTIKTEEMIVKIATNGLIKSQDNN